MSNRLPVSERTRETLQLVLVVVLTISLFGGAVTVSGLVPAPSLGGQGPVVTDVTGETTVTAEYATASNEQAQFSVTDIDVELSNEAENWAYIPRSSLPPELASVDGNVDAGVLGVGDWAVVGNLTASTVYIDRQSVRVVAPVGMDVDPARKAYFLETFLSPYSFHPNPTGRVTLVIAPSALPAAGVMYGDRGYIAQTAFWDGTAGSVWIHEYIHSQRAFTLTPEMQWFNEASATYFSYRVMEEQYHAVSDEDVQNRLFRKDTYHDAPLANPAEWEGTHADYYRGAKLLYVTDAAVRAGSDGERTLVDVYRTMNRDEDPITVDGFVHIVERHSGGNEQWLHEAITTDRDLNRSVQRSESEFESDDEVTDSGTDRD